MNSKMFHKNIIYTVLSLTSLSSVFMGTFENTAYAEKGSEVSADNSKVNKRDRSDQEVTAGQQSNTKTDVQITSKIRQSLMKDKNLSTAAHNVKIITDNGNVTLKGPVRSEQEKI